MLESPFSPEKRPRSSQQRELSS